MTTRKTLSEQEIKEAIRFWLKSQNITQREDAGACYLYQDPGDPPISGKQIFANVEIEEDCPQCRTYKPAAKSFDPDAVRCKLCQRWVIVGQTFTPDR